MIGDDRDIRINLDRGVYAARRAAALAGVPLRTLRHWAYTGFFRPSVSPEPREYLWSWSDLLALRAIDWFRRRKDDPPLPRASLQHIREALAELEHDRLPRHTLRDLAIADDGRLFFVDVGDHPVLADASRQAAMSGALNLVGPYQDRGPDLLEPRPLLRILPGKLHGEPHVLHTRISTLVLYELHLEGYEADQIRRMYPDVPRAALDQAIELEQSLTAVA